MSRPRVFVNFWLVNVCFRLIGLYFSRAPASLLLMVPTLQMLFPCCDNALVAEGETLGRAEFDRCGPHQKEGEKMLNKAL